jgi:signal transduction histidine kinase
VILLVVLLLPLSGAYFFRLYETELVRQTESELITQGVFISSLYKQALYIAHAPADYGAIIPDYAKPPDNKYRPYPPLLDLREADILPPRPDGVKPAQPPDRIAEDIGKRLHPVLHNAQRSTLSGMILLDYRGVVISGTGDTGLSLADVPEVKAALSGNYASTLRQRISNDPRPALASISRDTDIRVFVAMPITRKDRVLGIAYLSRSPRNVLKALYEERNSVFQAAAFILLMTAAIAWVLGTAIGKPLSALTRHAQQLTAGERPKDKLPSPPIAELASLTRSFETMYETIEARSAYIRSFAMHLAHEFKTPLTSIQGAVELLHDHPHDMKPDQRLRFLDNIIKDADRLKKLVTRVLELARADVMQPRFETTDAAPLLQRLEKQYAPKLALQAPSGPLAVNVGGDILETVLVNLLENSLQHGAKNIGLAVAPEDGGFCFDVTDDGEGISEGNAQKLFTPFFTTRRDRDGTGLGLVISKSLLKSCGGDIRHIPEKSGAHFRVTLKAGA